MINKPNDNPGLHHRRSIRLPGYNYSQNNAYFITLCTQNRKPIFGEIIDDKMVLNKSGTIAEQYWLEIPDHFPKVILDEFIIMPNHIHGILFIRNRVGVQNLEPLQNRFQHIIPDSIGSIIRGFKIGLTKWFRQNTRKQKIWQRNFYEHIVRTDDELNEVREYIQNNQIDWEKDENYVNQIK